MEKEMILQPGYMTVSEYARLYNLTVQAVYWRVKNNKLDVKKIGTFTLVRERL